MISQWIDKSKKNDQNFQRKGDHQISRNRKRRKKKKSRSRFPEKESPEKEVEARRKGDNRW